MSSLTLEEIQSMVTMQGDLNIVSCGVDWKTGVTSKGRTIDWKLCMKQECGEAIDSLNWKHWKDIDAVDDIENLKMELTDILFFLISDMLSSFKNESDIAEILFNKFSEETPEVTATTLQLLVFLQDLLGMSSFTGKMLAQMGEGHLTKQIATVTESELDVEAKALWGQLIGFFESGMRVISIFKVIVSSIDGFEMRDIYELYNAKYALNIFRQKNGYAEGTYVKTWGDVEDNAFLMKAYVNLEVKDISSITAMLTTEYAKWKKQE